MFEEPGHKPLTRRQAEIMEYLSAGYKRETIAQKMGLSIYTLRAHIRTIWIRFRVTREKDALTIWETQRWKYYPAEQGRPSGTDLPSEPSQ